MDAQVTLMDQQELLRDVLINNEFDTYVARHPTYDDPDFLLSLLHLRFVEESGWQNPFGFADLEVDDLLDAQRRTRGTERRDRLAELQRTVARSNRSRSSRSRRTCGRSPPRTTPGGTGSDSGDPSASSHSIRPVTTPSASKPSSPTSG